MEGPWSLEHIIFTPVFTLGKSCVLALWEANNVSIFWILEFYVPLYQKDPPMSQLWVPETRPMTRKFDTFILWLPQ